MGDIEPLLRICERIHEGTSIVELTDLDSDDLERALQAALANDQNVGLILNGTFPAGIPVDSSFYEAVLRLGFAVHRLPQEKVKAFLAMVWIFSYKSHPDEQKPAFLGTWLTNSSHIWPLAHSLPEFLRNIELPTEFAALWFKDLTRMVANDLMNGVIHRAITEYAIQHSGSADMILAHLDSSERALQEDEITVAASLIAGFRIREKEDHTTAPLLDRWDDVLQKSGDVGRRLSYYRSWRMPIRRGVASLEDVLVELSKAFGGTDDEVVEAISQAAKIVRSPFEYQVFAEAITKWLLDHTDSALPPAAKYAIAEILAKMDKDEITDELLMRILPIPAEHKGTWHEVGEFLARTLKADRDRFMTLTSRLLAMGGNEFVSVFGEDALPDLIMVLRNLEDSDLQIIVSRFLLSRITSERQFALLVVRKTPITALSVVESPPDIDVLLRLALWESIRFPLSTSDETSRFLLILEPLFRDTSEETQDILVKELVFQAINYPGGCLEHWRKIVDPSALLRKALQAADDYFGNIRKAVGSPATSFTFPEMAHADDRQRRDMSESVAKGAKEESLFGSIDDIFVHVDLIYGERQFFGSLGGEIGAQELNLREYSHHMEIPRMEVIDPEGMVFRRVDANLAIEAALHREDADG